MIKLFFYVLCGLILTACAKAQPSDTPQIPSGYLYKVTTAVLGKDVYICGQRPFNANGELVGVGDLTLQTKQVFENIKASLQTVNMTLRDVTQVTYMLKSASTRVDSTQARAVNMLAIGYFTQVPAIVEMKSVSQNVRDDVLIEIEVVAIK